MPISLATKIFEVDAGPPVVRLLFLDLAYLADRKGVIRHSQTEIAGRLGLSRQQVARYMTLMEGCGILEREHRGRYRWSHDVLSPAKEIWLQETGAEPPDFAEHIAQVAAAAAESRKPIRDSSGAARTRRDADEEMERLKSVREPHQGIFYTRDGWPVLRSM